MAVERAVRQLIELDALEVAALTIPSHTSYLSSTELTSTYLSSPNLYPVPLNLNLLHLTLSTSPLPTSPPPPSPQVGVTPGAGLKGGTRYEQLTPLGKHLSALPVDVRIGTPTTPPYPQASAAPKTLSYP